MNTYKKYCPNVFVAQTKEKYQKGDTIIVTTRYGKENEHIIHNLVGEKNGFFLYSITRLDGYNSQERAKKKVSNLNQWADNAEKRSDEWYERSQEGKDFLSLGEPIKIGHHSEKRHRALIERNYNRMKNSVEEQKKADSYRSRTSYWEKVSEKIDLSMPESIDYFKNQLEEAIEHHKGLKDGSIKREHTYSLTYAKKRCNELEKKYKIAQKLWA